jgi:predicted nucleic acid-binding protein
VTQFVLDASVSLAWYVDNPPDPYALRIWDHVRAGARPVVPLLWILECANTLFVAERRKLLDPAASTVIIEDFEELLAGSFDVIASPATLRDLVESSRSFQLTAYDAVYLLLAVSLDLPLATLDSSLRSAARRAGVPIFS